MQGKGVIMKNKYTTIIKKEDDWWLGWVEEISGVNCQERTREELIETLRITLKEALAMNKSQHEFTVHQN
jgi:predicted RNase H-like HicB family nuclease